MIKNKMKQIGLGVVLSIGLFGASLNATELLGAGATFPYPLYSKMFDAYHKETGVKVNYQAIGSGGGIRQIINKTVDFGGSDAFLTDKKLKKMKAPVLHIPICSGAVAIAYNLPGVTDLKLTPTVLSNIYLGNIKKWNDERIQKINPGKKLPGLKILSAQRSDGSGTTFIFTDYLSKVNDEWKKKVGTGKAVNWPTGLGGKGNSGVAGLISQIPGSIGYVSSVYAIQNKMPMAAIQNKKGHYIMPTLEAITEASNTEVPNDTRASLTNTNSVKGYPISGLTWIIVYKDQYYNKRSKGQAMETVKLLRWMVNDGQRFATPLNYSPLSKTLAKKANKVIDLITYKEKNLGQLKK